MSLPCQKRCFRPIILLLAITWCIGNVTGQSCPSTCQCHPPLVTCKGGDLTQILWNIPSRGYNVIDISFIRSVYQLEKTHFDQFSAKAIVQQLAITDSQIQKVGENTFTETTSLVKLNLSQNIINEISPSAFKNLRNCLREFDLSKNRISSINASSISSLGLLTYLNLGHNNIRSMLSGSFNSLPYLQTLILDGNPISGLQGHVFQGLGNLRHLSLKGCGIMHIPSDMFHIIRKLQIINLQSNYIQTIPTAQELRNLAYLEQIYLDSNRITELGDLQFGSLPVDTLGLSRNRIRRVSGQAFKYFNAKYVDLSFNQIDWIYPGTLQPLAPEVTSLNLAGNPISSISNGVLQGLYRLEILNLSRCGISSLPDNDFQSLQSLKILDIAFNGFRNLSRSVTNIMNSLKIVSLEQNPWHCNCYIEPLRQWLHSSNNRQKLFCSQTKHGQYIQGCDDVICKSPTEMNGLSLVELEDEQVAYCEQDDSDDVSINTIVIIISILVVITCAGIIIFIVLWKTKCYKKLLERKSKSVKPPYQPYNGDATSVDLGSINESDRGFPLRTYMQALENMNGQYYDITPTDSQTRASDQYTAGSGSDFGLETQSHTGSSATSTIVIGRESAV